MIIEQNIVITTRDGREITLNEQQVEAVHKIQNWLRPNNKEIAFTLSGFAGTGKTTIVTYILDNYNGQVCVTAPTHKAKKVIQRTTGRKALTIQGLLGLRPNTSLENFDINNPQFHPIAEKLISEYELVVVDEASMVNNGLFTLLIREAKENNVKILFMGDSAQAPPINEKLSRVFTEVKDCVNLTKVERQAESNPLLGICDAIRDNLTEECPFPTFDNVNDAGGLKYITNQLDIEHLLEEMYLSDDYQQDYNHCKTVAYQNTTVKGWNRRIRKLIFPNADSPIVEGDLFMAYNTVVVNEKYNAKKDSFFLENSNDYEVSRILNKYKSGPIGMVKVIMTNVDDGSVQTFPIVYPDSENYKKFYMEWKLFHDTAQNATPIDRKKAWAKYYDFKNQHLLISDITVGKDLIPKDLDYGYAITAHKCQGSTYTNVIIDNSDMLLIKKVVDRNKLSYVALSRPTKMAYLIQ